MTTLDNKETHEDDWQHFVEHDDGEFGGHHLARNAFSEYVRDSFRAVEVAALSTPLADDHRHSISSRLGGLGGSFRLDPSHVGSFPNSPVINEKTVLLQAKKVEEGSTDSDLEHQIDSPPLIKWIFPALLCAVAYALYNICIKKGSSSIHPILGGVILQFVAALCGLLLLGALLMRGSASKIHYDKMGLIWSIGAGIWVGTAEMLSFFVSGMGVPATQFIPIIIGGSVMFGAVLGLLLLGETLMLHGWSGVFMLTVGIAMVATDPGPKVEEGGDVVDGEVEAPPLLVWIGPALICALSYALYNICIKKGSSSINPILGGVVLQFVAAAFGSCMLAFLLIEESAPPKYDFHGIFWACWAGVAVGSAELLSFCVSGMGVQATQSIPILIGGSVMFGAVFGIIMLGESLMFQGWGGVALLMTGIGFVATDPGEKVSGH